MNCDCEKRHVIGCRNVKEPFPKAPPKRLRQQSDKRKALAPVRKAFVDRKLAKDKVCQIGIILAAWAETGVPEVTDVPSRGTAFERGGHDIPKCLKRATAVHEPLTRARSPGAETILDEDNALSTCERCHDFAHAHPALSESLGLLRSSRGLGGK